MLIEHVEEDLVPVPDHDPPTPNGRAVLELLKQTNATLDQVAAKSGLTSTVACQVLGNLKRGGWVGVMRYYKEEGASLLISEWFARREAKVIQLPAAG